MKLAFIFHDRPDYAGGPIVNARRLLPELVRRGHEVHCLLFYTGHAPGNAAFLEKNGVRCRTHPQFDSTERKVRWTLGLVRDLEPDAFIPNLSVAGCFAARWVRESGIPTIAVIRSGDAFSQGFVAQFVGGGPEWSVSAAVCVSEALAQQVRHSAGNNIPVHVIPSGVPIPSAMSKQTGPLRLVYSGRLVNEAKRIIDLIDAIGRSLSDRSELTASVLGEGELRFAVEQRIRELGLSGRICLHGKVPEDRLHAQLVEHDVLVLLSDYEGTPGAVMDGMAAGLVPVCLDIPGGVRELVIHEHTGLLVADRHKAFSEAIHRLADDPVLRQRLAVNARRHVRQHFSLPVAADRWEDLLHTLCESSRGTRRAILVPKHVPLPPVQPDLAREDIRNVAPPTRLLRAAVRAAKRFVPTLR